MKTFQTRNLTKTLVVLFFICTLLARPTASKGIASNLHVAGISNVSETSIANAANHGLGTFEPAERAVLETSRATAVSLPRLATLAPNPKWSAIFPMFGLIAAVAVTQLLRRRRIAQLRSSSSTVQ